MTSRIYRLIFLTLPATVLVLWLAAGRYNDNRIRDHRDAALQVARALDIATLLYAEEHHDQLPPADSWEDALRPYLGNVPLTLPQNTGGHGRRFAMNRAVAGHKLSALGQPGSVILYYETTSSHPDTTDDFDTMLPPDDPNNLVLAYADGHVEDYYPAAARDSVIKRSRDALKTVAKR